MNEILLLGAGASVEAGVPHATEMSKQILQRFRDDPMSRRDAHVLSFAIGGLLFQAGIRNSNPYDGVNVEDLFNAVQLLGERYSLEAAPFIGSWHSMVEDFDRVAPAQLDGDRVTRVIHEAVSQSFKDGVPTLSSSDETKINNALVKNLERITKKQSATGYGSLGREIGEVLQAFAKKWAEQTERKRPASSRVSEVGRELGKAVQGQQTRPGAGEVFRRTNLRMISQLRDLVWIDTPDRVAYLSPLLTLLSRQERLVVATLNYDNAIELVASTNGISCDTGLSEWSASRTFDFAGPGLKLLKLHGSIDWVYRRSQLSVERPIPHQSIDQVADVTRSTEDPAVIFGQKNKLTAEGPFLDLIAGFRRELDKASLLTVIGYSFRDAHINEYIKRWINEEPKRRIRVVDPNFQRNEAPFALDLKRYLVGRLEVVASYTGRALVEMYPG